MTHIEGETGRPRGGFNLLRLVQFTAIIGLGTFVGVYAGVSAALITFHQPAKRMIRYAMPDSNDCGSRYGDPCRMVLVNSGAVAVTVEDAPLDVRIANEPIEVDTSYRTLDVNVMNSSLLVEVLR